MAITPLLYAISANGRFYWNTLLWDSKGNLYFLSLEYVPVHYWWKFYLLHCYLVPRSVCPTSVTDEEVSLTSSWPMIQVKNPVLASPFLTHPWHFGFSGKILWVRGMCGESIRECLGSNSRWRDGSRIGHREELACNIVSAKASAVNPGCPFRVKGEWAQALCTCDISHWMWADSGNRCNFGPSSWSVLSPPAPWDHRPPLSAVCPPEHSARYCLCSSRDSGTHLNRPGWFEVILWRLTMIKAYTFSYFLSVNFFPSL